MKSMIFSRRQITWSIVVLCLLALALRIAMIYWQSAWRTPNYMEHRSVALSLLNGKGFAFGDWSYYGPSTVQSTPYPFLLEQLFRLFGTEGSQAWRAYTAAMYLNALAGALTVWVTYLLVKTLGGNDLAALLAAAACAIWPTQIYAARMAQAICFITLGITAAIVLFYRAVRSGNLSPWIAFSVIACLTVLTEPVFLPSIILAGVLVLFWRGLPPGVRVRNAAILLVTALDLIGPWTVRNHIVHGAWVPIKNTVWVNIWKGNNDFATGTDRLEMTAAQKRKIINDHVFATHDEGIVDSKEDANRQYDMLSMTERARLRNQPEIVREQVFKSITLNWIKTHPRHYLELCGTRLIKSLWLDWDNPKAWNVFYIASRVILLPLIFFGIFVAIGQRWSLLFPAIIVFTCLLTLTLTITAARFEFPMEPMEFAMAGAFVAAVLGKLFGAAPQSQNGACDNNPAAAPQP